MAPPAFRSAASAHSHGFGQVAAPPSARASLAIVSTSSKLCGVAAYTAALRRQLADAFDITLFDLDQYLLRSQHRRVRRLADQHIREICRQLARFDYVNLQLEHGTLGRYGGDIYRRFCWLSAAAPRLSVTFHTLLMPPRFDWGAFLDAAAKLRWRSAAAVTSDFRRGKLLSQGIGRQLRRLQRRKPVSAIVHNRRDRSDAHYLHGIERVFDHPLAYMEAAEIEAVRAAASRRHFAMLDGLPDDAVLVGVFGFLNEYKGITTAIQALQYIPANHQLLIFGGVHPQEIQHRQARHPYISTLFEHAYMDTTLYDRMSAASARSETAPLVVGADQVLRELLGSHPRDLSARIHFMGALAEEDFLGGMAVCDAVVFPYLEVGQSSSGPISQALELGCRIVASRTRAFLEFAEYHKDAVEFFDIGNHLELAERLLARPQYARAAAPPGYNVASNKAIYLVANSPPRGPSGRTATRLRERAAPDR